MTTPPPGPTPGETGNDAEERLRALLAAARVDTPVPDDVATRLDDALAAAVRQRTEATSVVVPFRRRGALHRAGLGRAAASVAAVLVVGGAAVGIHHLGGDAGSASSADGLVARSPRPSAPEAGSAAGGLSEGTSLPALRRSHFATGVERLLGATNANLQAGSLAARSPAAKTPKDEGAKGRFDTQPQASAACSPDAASTAHSLRREVTFDGRLAVLVVTDRAGRRVATAYACDGTVLDRTTLAR